jgi:hypothetical protein
MSAILPKADITGVSGMSRLLSISGVFKEAEQIWATVSSPISFPVTTSRVRKDGRSGRICCFFVLPLIFLDFFRLRFSFVYLCCVRILLRQQ